MFAYHFVDPDLRVKIIFRKEETAENGGEGRFLNSRYRHLYILVLAHELIPFLASPWQTKHNMDF